MAGSSSATLGQRSFSFADQEAFARLSGDFNPIHVDAVAARRSVVGDLVVHGVHTVLWALDVLAGSEFAPKGVRSLDVRFPKPVYLGDRVSLSLDSATDKEVRLRAEVGSKTVAIVRLGVRSEGLDPPASNDNAREQLDLGGVPVDLTFDDFTGRTGTVAFAVPIAEFAARFPAAAGLVGAARLREFAACSRLVGMDCPGLRSVFARLSLEWEASNAPSSLNFEVTDTFPDYGLVHITCQSAGLTGKIEAFSPPPPPRQLSVAELSQLVRPDEFAAQSALIIGGSRGLGELTAKAIAAGGGRVLITYAVGQSDASRLVDEIRSFGGKADLLQYDVTRPAVDQLRGLNATVPTHVYYYATCHIARPGTMALDHERLNRFMEFYVHGFFNLCTGLDALGMRPSKAFYPSTVFVADRPKGFLEYAIAKSAGEVLCKELTTILPGLDVVCERLPRLMTDQNVTVNAEDVPSALDAVLPIVRSMNH